MLLKSNRHHKINTRTEEVREDPNDVSLEDIAQVFSTILFSSWQDGSDRD
jgi:hypothetical protein